jgi:hypothetical protein
MGLLEGDSRYGTINLVRDRSFGLLRYSKRSLAKDLKEHNRFWCDPKRSNMTNLFNIKAY